MSTIAAVALALSCVGILLAAIVYINVSALRTWWLERQLARYGIETKAAILAIEFQRPHRGMHHCDIDLEYAAPLAAGLEYAAPLAAGLEYAAPLAAGQRSANPPESGSQIMRRSFDADLFFCQIYDAGDMIEIRYLPQAPHLSSVTGNAQPSLDLFVMSIVDIGCLVAGLYLWREAKREGAAATGASDAD